MFLHKDKRGSSKGQFTIIIILGLVVFFTFVLLFLVRAQQIKAQLNNQVNNQIKDYISQNSINIYVTTCLDAVVNEGITRASMQGGVLNFSGRIYG